MTLRNHSLFVDKTAKKKLTKETLDLLSNPDHLIEIISKIKSKELSRTKYTFGAGPIEINASAEIVFNVAMNVAKYKDYSKGTMSVYSEEEIKPGTVVTIKLYEDDAWLKCLPASDLTVIVAGKVKEYWVIGWGMEAPMGGYTERYQLIEALPDNKCKSTFVDIMTTFLGVFTLPLKAKIDNAFENLNEGIKLESETQAMRLT